MRVAQEPQRFEAEVAVLSLGKEAEREGLTVADRVALSNQDLRRQMVRSFMRALLVGDLFAVVALGIWSYIDQHNLEAKLIAPGDRIIGQQAVVALLGATTVQVGAIAAIIARNLFPGRTADR